MISQTKDVTYAMCVKQSHGYIIYRDSDPREESGGIHAKVECRRVGGGVASHKWWERPARQTEGTSAISIREGWGCLSVYARVCEGREVCKDDEGRRYGCGKHT